jgi:AcrR family transcriptional regulator
MNVSKRKAERIGQKERTRQNLLSAARALVEEGETLTIARAAERANLAEATAYRYYRNPRSLLRDALSIDWSGLNDVLAALSILPSAADRAQRAAEEMAQFVLARELSIRLLFASTDQEPRDREAASGLPRASFRRRLVEAVLHGAEETLGASGSRRR